MSLLPKDKFAASVLMLISAGASEWPLLLLGRRGIREDEDDNDEEGAALDDILEGWFTECIRILSRRMKSNAAEEEDKGGGRRWAAMREDLEGCVSALSVLADAAFPESKAVDPAAIEKEEGVVDDNGNGHSPQRRQRRLLEQRVWDVRRGLVPHRLPRPLSLIVVFV